MKVDVRDIPNGWKLNRIGKPVKGERYIDKNGVIVMARQAERYYGWPMIIVEPEEIEGAC